MTSAAASSNETNGHRGRRDDPLYRVRNILRAGQEHLSDRQQAGCASRSQPARNMSRSRSIPVSPAGQRLLPPGHTRAAGRRLAATVLTSLPTRPIPEAARSGAPLKQWREAFLGHLDTNWASNDGTEAVNALIELHRRTARGFRNRDNCRLRMLLTARVG
jgi:hypothetical protein